jgi:hypothetical protein
MHVGAENLEATYHVVWTLKALSNSSVSEHFLLPTVTLEPRPGNDISWGATVPTPKGSYIYTSFPPLGFLVPFFALRAVDLPLEVFTLAVFNSLVGLVAALGIGGLIRSVALHVKNNGGLTSDPSHVTGWLIFIASSTCYLFLRESLQSHGAVYWPHSLSQVVFIFASWLAFRSVLNRAARWESIALVTLCALYPLLEWTGFIFNFGLVAGLALYRLYCELSEFVFGSLRTTAGWMFLWHRVRGLPVVITVVTLVVGVAMLLHLFFAIGVNDSLHALANRAISRSGASDPLRLLGVLPLKYLSSFAGLLVIGIFAGVIQFRQRVWRYHPAYIFILGISTFPMVENLVMLQHAYWFSFDRLKLAVPLMLLVFTFVSTLEVRRRFLALALSSIFIVSTNIATFRLESVTYDPWVNAMDSNARIVAELEAHPLASCALFASTGKVRGYLNLLLERDIYEYQREKDINRRTEESRACASVTINHEHVFVDLPRITSILIRSMETGRSEELPSP